MDDETLYRLVYISTAVTPFTPEQLDELVRDASRRNEARGMTGMLCYYAGDFLQILEGEKGPLSTLWEKVRRDPRHTWVERLLWGPTDHRLFGPWHMGLCEIRDHESDVRSEFRAIHHFLTSCTELDTDRIAVGLLDHFRRFAARHTRSQAA